METANKPILYIDMDNVLVDFKTGIARLDEDTRRQYKEMDNVPGIFALMDPMPGAIEAYRTLSTKYDVYILSTAPWNNPSAWSDKLLWVKKYLGNENHKRLIISHHKNLNKGSFLIDDRRKNGAGEFEGELIEFGSGRFPGWKEVTGYLMDK